MVKFIGLLRFTKLLFSYLSELGENANSNFIISPMSAFTAMCMVNNGARGPTRDEIQSALQVIKKNNFCEEAEKLMEFLESDGNVGLSLDLANGMFTNKSFEPFRSFKTHLQQKYQADSERVLFGTKEGEKIVNDWVEEKTNGKIRDILKQTNSRTIMVLVNAIYMKGQWHVPFLKTWTQHGTFFASTREIAADFMSDTRKLRYLESTINGTKFQAVFVPYGHDNSPLHWKMALILPEKRGNPVELKGLISKRLFKVYTKSVTEYLRVKIPKCKMESDIDLKPLLIKLGVERAYTYAANFSGIRDNIPIRIDNVTQKAFLSVDEEGVEAAAATIVQTDYCLSSKHDFMRPIYLYFDSPFLFAIINVKENIILFAGIVAEPKT